VLGLQVLFSIRPMYRWFGRFLGAKQTHDVISLNSAICLRDFFRATFAQTLPRKKGNCEVWDASPQIIGVVNRVPGEVLRSAHPTPRTVAFNDLLFAAWYSKQ
jgi:hypothetical protein